MVRFVESVEAIDAAASLPKVLLIGTKETPGNALAQRVLAHVNHKTALSPAAVALLEHAIKALAPSPDNAAAKHLYLPLGNSLVSVVVAQLPTAVARHNTLARPHAISALVKSHASDKTATIVALALPDPTTTTWAAGVGVAKGVTSYYAHKSSGVPSGVITDGSATAVHADQVVVVFDAAVDAATLKLLNATATGIHLTQRLVDAPPNQLNTDTFTAEARAVAARTQSDILVIRGQELNDKGFGGIYGVGKASDHPPALVVLSHYPNEASKTAKSVALVGKGITYDTGGLSLKPSSFMVGMKQDMGGAAGLLGAFEAAVLSGRPTRALHVVLCLAENSVAANATRPDDVHTLYSGKTVEINNTDAEGRLVLGDGVAYAAKHLNPQVILDMATLTGAQGVATGNKHGAVVSNDATLEQWLVRAGKASGDLVHPMPYVPEFFREEFKSQIADMKNIPACRTNAQVSCAGQFIANHLGEFEETGQWGHIDMAYPVIDNERATGFGVALVQSLLAQIQ
ncbi:Aste57867_3532 [Aphanomyces stellatus]|uniref:Aste57867_3532 protein n=1 Tax=Aphanomyces stellatus TaxID=120398 RepID=A0A485KAY8_9STRA|nr:hypothetical protein As57867_003521 [Aphanomyces stellatus]VFT80695.1 Aste57867_3532 [Aphanomyces stellatus]